MDKHHRRLWSTILTLLAFLWLFCDTSLAQEKASAQSDKHFLWAIENGENTLYLLGSLHIIKRDSFPLAPEIENAYRDCERIVFETDIDGMKDPAFQTKMLALGFYPGGQTLAQNVSEQTYRLFQEKVEAIGLPVAQFERFKPWLCALTLSLAELRSLGFDPNYGIDRYFFHKAQRDRKEIIFLETIEYQLDIFADMIERQQEAFLKQTLKDLEVVAKLASDMLNAWKTGDIDKLESILTISFREHPDIYDLFFIRRNKKWISQIENLLGQSGNVLVIVGAGHLVGNDSIVDLLKKKGHEIEQR